MRTSALLASLLVATLVAPAFASHTRDGRPPLQTLRGADCLKPEFARGFIDLDDRSILVDSGRRRHLIEVSGSCWNLDYASIISFRGDPISNRVCGSAFDAVLVRGSPPCRITRMELISKEEYELALREREELRRARRIERQSRHR